MSQDPHEACSPMAVCGAGDLPCIDSFRAQVACLEAANAAQDAALRRYGGHGMDCVWTHKDGQHCACGFLAALSDTAGEDWLPPEVRKQIAAFIQARGHAPSGCGIRVGPNFKCTCGFQAALDALEGEG